MSERVGEIRDTLLAVELHKIVDGAGNNRTVDLSNKCTITGKFIACKGEMSTWDWDL